MIIALVALAVVVFWGAYWLLGSSAPTRAADEATRVTQRAAVDRDQVELPPAPMPVTAPSPLNQPASPAAVEAEPAPAIRVRVVNERGIGVGSVPVNAFTEPDTGIWYERFTDSGGHASLECPAGNYALGANSRGEIAPYGSRFQLVEVIESRTTLVELRLPDLTGRIDLLVQDDRGVPIEGAVVDGQGPAGRVHAGERTTDEHGSASWAPVVEGNWRLSVTSVDAAHSFDKSKRQQVFVKPGQVKQVTVVLPRMGRVVVNRAQIPQLEELVRLSLLTESGTDRRNRPWTAEQEVWPAPPGTALLSAEWTAAVGVWSRPQVLTVLPGEDAVARVEVQPGASVLTGRVVDVTGTPVEGVSITATVYERMQAGSQGDGKLSLLTRKVAASDASGNVSVRGLPEGELHGWVSVVGAKGRYLAEYGSNTGHVPGFIVEDATLPLDVVVVPGVMLQGSVGEPWATRWANTEVWLRILQEQPSGAAMRYRRHEPRVRDDGTFTVEHRVPGLYSAVMMDRTGALTDPVLFDIPEGLVEGATAICHLTFAR